MIDSDGYAKPFKSTAASANSVTKNLAVSLLYVSVGVVVGAIAFAQLFSCVGYYALLWLCGFQRTAYRRKARDGTPL